MTMAFTEEVRALVEVIAKHPDALLFAEVVGVWATASWVEVTLALGEDRLTLSAAFYEPDCIGYRTWRTNEEDEAVRGKVSMPQAYETFMRLSPALLSMVVAQAKERLG